MSRAYMTGLSRCAKHSRCGGMRGVDAGMCFGMMMYILLSLIITRFPLSAGGLVLLHAGPRKPQIVRPAWAEIFSLWTRLSIGNIAIWSPTRLLRERSTG